jgi:hypothetical protein
VRRLARLLRPGHQPPGERPQHRELSIDFTAPLRLGAHTFKASSATPTSTSSTCSCSVRSATSTSTRSPTSRTAAPTASVSAARCRASTRTMRRQLQLADLHLRPPGRLGRSDTCSSDRRPLRPLHKRRPAAAQPELPAALRLLQPGDLRRPGSFQPRFGFNWNPDRAADHPRRRRHLRRRHAGRVPVEQLLEHRPAHQRDRHQRNTSAAGVHTRPAPAAWPRAAAAFCNAALNNGERPHLRSAGHELPRDQHRLARAAPVNAIDPDLDRVAAARDPVGQLRGRSRAARRRLAVRRRLLYGNVHRRLSVHRHPLGSRSARCRTAVRVTAPSAASRRPTRTS